MSTTTAPAVPKWRTHAACRGTDPALFYDADPDEPALDQLLELVWLPNATAYTALQRAVRLGVVEHRGRGLYPVRR